MTANETFTPPSSEEAARLYEAAARVKELAPWQWMDESELFGVQHPETGELGFVSIMGMAGEHFAVAVYQGAEGLHGILDFATSMEMPNPDQLLDIPQLQASFEDRELLEKEDRAVIKKLGLKFRGPHAWPMFRSYRAGFMPWHVTDAEASLLAVALEQTLEVAPRVKADPQLLDTGNDEESYLVRVPRKEGDAVTWSDQFMRVPPPEPQSIEVVMDMGVLNELREAPQRELEFEADFFSMPTGVGQKGERPYRPYMLMLADSRSGMIIGVELMSPLPTLAEMHGRIPSEAAQLLAQAGVLPAAIIARSELLLSLLEPLAAHLNVELQEADELPSIDAAMDSMFGMLMGGGF
jgi:hypothetical protein